MTVLIGRFSPSTPSEAPAIHAVLNSTKAPKRGAPRKSFVVTFALVAGPSKAPVSPEEAASKSLDKGKGKEKDSASEGEELGRWDLLVRREVAGKPITVFDVRSVVDELTHERVAHLSTSGKLLAYGCADLSIGILDSKTLAVSQAMM